MTTKSFLLGCSIAAALVTATPVRAENLIEVYLDAVRGDPLVREAEARRDAALEAKPQARGALLPQVNVNGQYATRDTDGENVFNQLFDPDNNPATDNSVIVPVRSTQSSDSDFWNYQAEITQSLFSWEQWQALKRADSSVAVAEATYRAAQQNLLVRVSQAYFDVLAAEDTLGAAEATLEALTRQLEQAEKRFEVGLIAVTDVQEARAAHDNARAGVIAAKRAVASAQEVLRELTNKDYQSLAKPAEAMPLDKPDPADEQAWVDLALKDNLDVIAARLNSDVASRDVKIAQGGHFPTRRAVCEPHRIRFASDADQQRPHGTGGFQPDAGHDRRAGRDPDLLRRRDAVTRARAGAPAPRSPRAARRRDAFSRARNARCLPGRDRREGARAGAAAGGEVEPDRARGDRSRF